MELIPDELVKQIAAEAIRRGLVNVPIEDLTAEKLAAALLSDREARESYVRMLLGERIYQKNRRRQGLRPDESLTKTNRSLNSDHR